MAPDHFGHPSHYSCHQIDATSDREPGSVGGWDLRLVLDDAPEGLSRLLDLVHPLQRCRLDEMELRDELREHPLVAGRDGGPVQLGPASLCKLLMPGDDALEGRRLRAALGVGDRLVTHSLSSEVRCVALQPFELLPGLVDLERAPAFCVLAAGDAAEGREDAARRVDLRELRERYDLSLRPGLLAGLLAARLCHSLG